AYQASSTPNIPKAAHKGNRETNHPSIASPIPKIGGIKRKIELNDYNEQDDKSFEKPPTINLKLREILKYGRDDLTLNNGHHFGEENEQLLNNLLQIKILNHFISTRNSPIRYMYQNLNTNCQIIEGFMVDTANDILASLSSDDLQLTNIAKTEKTNEENVALVELENESYNDIENDINKGKDILNKTQNYFNSFTTNCAEDILTYGQILNANCEHEHPGDNLVFFDAHAKSKNTKDSITHNNNLNTNTVKMATSGIILRGSRELCNGSCIKLDVTSRLKEYSIFPGQIMALKGNTANGRSRFMVQDIYYPSIPKPDIIPEMDGLSKNLNILVFGSPFTHPTQNLDFEPLHDSLALILSDKRPDICIMIGPFIDNKHPIVENYKFQNNDNTADMTFEEIFVQKILAFIYSYVLKSKNNTIKFLLVSSYRDVFQRFDVYPTPSYNIDLHQHQLSDIENNVMFLPDPCILNINGIIIALSSTDTLFHLSCEEISFYPETTTDRMGRLVKHIISHKSFYPLQPPSLDINIDYELLQKYALLPKTPHLIILPSDLKYFVKNIEDCVAINPGRFIKGSFPGTFAEIIINKNIDNIYNILDHCCIKIFGY
ncbi:unnamed protein product, partial [Gordionus sp. m RMFG-2023]